MVLIKEGGESEVSEHPLAITLPQQYVFGLEVSVHDLFLLEVLKCGEYLSEDGEDHACAQLALVPHVLVQRSSRQVLSDQVNEVFRLVDSFVLDDVGVGEVPQGFYFVI